MEKTSGRGAGAALLLVLLSLLLCLWEFATAPWRRLVRLARGAPRPGVPSRVVFLPLSGRPRAVAGWGATSAPLGLLEALLRSPAERAAAVLAGIAAERLRKTPEKGVYVYDFGPDEVQLFGTLPEAGTVPGSGRRLLVARLGSRDVGAALREAGNGLVERIVGNAADAPGHRELLAYLRYAGVRRVAPENLLLVGSDFTTRLLIA